MRLHVGHHHSQFLPILPRFVYYYSLFWGPGVISTINEFWVRFRFGHQHSQFWPILARFVDYNSLVRVPEGFPRLTNPWCVFVSVMNNRGFLRFCPFRGLLLPALGS